MKPLVLCILDGMGIRKEEKGNAFKQAKMPNFDKMWKTYPHSILKASGEAVGLPKGQMGNSEVGHMNIGAGRLFYQPQELINSKIKDKTFFNNDEILKIINHTKNNNSKLHIMGLISDGGVHSHIAHLMAILDMCKQNNIKDLYLHLFTDGRDVDPSSAYKYISEVEEKLKTIGIGKIATISGRYYAMDRDNNYDRLKKAYDVIVNGEGSNSKSIENFINESYEKGITDEFLIPTIFDKKGILEENDGIIVFNYRKDRLRELFTAITNPDFNEIEVTKFNNIKTVTMFPVVESVIATHAYSDPSLKNILGSYLEKKSISQLRIAETEKYAHVTFFFDGGKEAEYKKEKKILIPSPKVATYDMQPEMSIYNVTDTLLKELDKNIYNVVILNFANGDMVGHTGNLEAAIKACEDVDKNLGKIYDKINELGGTLIVTADHGNCELMLDSNDNIVTSHTTNNVPFIITNKKYKLKNGKLSDIAPTMLYILGLDIPKEMTGEVLIQNGNYKKKKLFVIISIILLCIMVSIYTYRFIHFYNLENGKEVKQDTSLVGKILTNNEVVVKGDGLHKNDDEYLFKGKVENNYVYYSGKLWRILKINGNKSIKLITNDNITSLVWNYENNNYENSYIRNYLNKREEPYTGIFYNTLNNPENYLVDTTFCIDKLNPNDLEKCDDAILDKIGLLNYKEYVDALAYKSFLNISKYFWTINGSENKVWYVYNEGGMNDKSYEGDTYYSYGVRPVITLKSGLDFIRGDGSHDNPYVIDENGLNSGSYINYNGYRWRIVSAYEDKIKIVMDQYIGGEAPIIKAFSTKNSNYNINDYYNIGHYLNNEFYNSLENKDLIVDGQWYNNIYGTETAYNYKTLYENAIIAKVGLLNVTEPYVADLEGLTMTKANEEMIYSVKENGNIFANNINEEIKVRPAMYISNNLNIVSGTGLQTDPYVIEGK